MSKYTTELRFICERLAGLNSSAPYGGIEQIILNSWDKIFDFNFPIFDETYRQPLCIKIIKHYYTREIGEETYGLWKLRLNERMNLIMPYYNKLYIAWQDEFIPRYNVDITRKHILDRNENTQGTQNSESTANNTNRDLYSDTPQGSLQNIDNETYLTNARKTTDSGEVNSTNEYSQKIVSTDNYIEQLTGVQGTSFSQMLKEYQQNLINIDALVIKDLNNLFMQLW